MTNMTVSLVYGLLIGKSTDNYNLFFEKALKQDNLQPESILTDFEIGSIKSVRERTLKALHKGMFSSTQKINSEKILGCLFHFFQAIQWQVQRKRLVTKYSEDEYFRLNVKKLIALAIIPVDEIITAFASIVNQFGNDADDLLDYFEKTWIAEGKRSGMLFVNFSLNPVHPRLFRIWLQEPAI